MQDAIEGARLAAARPGLEIIVVSAHNESEIDQALTSAADQHAVDQHAVALIINEPLQPT
jgi:hypothetical protein